MKKYKVVHPANLPGRLPITGGLVWWLFLDRIDAWPWVYGVVFTFWGIFFILQVIGLIIGEQTRIFDKSTG